MTKPIKPPPDKPCLHYYQEDPEGVYTLCELHEVEALVFALTTGHVTPYIEDIRDGVIAMAEKAGYENRRWLEMNTNKGQDERAMKLVVDEAYSIVNYVPLERFNELLSEANQHWGLANQVLASKDETIH